MVIPEIVSGVMSVLMPYVAKGAEKFAAEAGKEAFERAKGLFATLKANLSGDEEASKELENFQQKPARYEGVVKSILEEKLASDEGLRSELARLLQGMGPLLHIIQEMKVGKGVTGLEADEVASGEIHIQQKIDQAENATGAKIKKFS
jgi:hypothetical protein